MLEKRCPEKYIYVHQQTPPKKKINFLLKHQSDSEHSRRAMRAVNIVNF